MTKIVKHIGWQKKSSRFFLEISPGTQEKIEREEKVCAHNYHPIPVMLTKGDGVWLYDIEGKKYIDMMSAYSAVSHGHCHPELLEVLKEQSSRLCITSRAFHADRLEPFLSLLCNYAGMDAALPMNTGAEAVETAIKAARKWGYEVKNIPDLKAEIIIAGHNFHGRTTTIVSFSTDETSRMHFGPYTPGFIKVPFGNAKEIERAITPNTAAILIEPMQGEAGIVIPPEGYLKDLRKIADHHNVLLILDEVQTGLSRTGKDFAFQHEGIKPDGLILGKALGGGILPVSAFLARKELMDVFTPGSHGSTFGGNPLAAAVAHKALEIMKRDGYSERSAELGAYFLNALKEIKSEAILDVRGKGLWIGLDLDPAFISGRDFCNRLLAKGILTKETHETTVRLAPPLIITKEQIETVLDKIRELFQEI